MSEEEESPELEGYEDEMDGMDDLDMDSIETFYHFTVKPGDEATPIPPPGSDMAQIRLTKACFGVEVQQGSRTVLCAIKQNDEGKDEEIPVAVLLEGKSECVNLDLVLNGPLEFAVKGRKVSAVTVSGYLDMSKDEGPDDLDLDNMDPEMLKKLQEGGDEESYDELDDDEAAAEDEEMANEIKQLVQQKKRQRQNEAAEDTMNEPPSKKSKKEKKGKNANQTTPGNEKKSPKQSPASPKDGANKQKTVQLKGGLNYKILKDGNGAEIKQGQKARVYYVGQLKDGTIFDKSISGPGFEFTLGKGEVIKGWDLGLKGMKVGGKRRLVVPAKLAYGKTGSPPDIPPNAELTFTIELKSVN